MEGPLKIAMFSDSALPILNGVSISIDVLVKELRNQGHSVRLFTASYRGYGDPDPNTHRFIASKTPWTRDYPVCIPPFYFMLHQFRKVKFDVIHTHTPWTVGFVGLRWGQSHDIPVVTTYHTLYDKYAHYIPLLPKRYTRYKIAKHTHYYYNLVDQIIAPSEEARRWLVRHTVRKPVTTVPTSIIEGKPLNRAQVRQHLHVPAKSKLLLYVGRIAKEKNLALLFQAIAIARKSSPHLLFWLVGDGPQRRELAALARDLGIGDYVRFVGFVPRREVDQYYSAADLFIFSSRTETQGLVVTEAMSHGLPAVVVKGGGAGAAVEDGVSGYLIENSSEEMAAKVLKLLDDQKLYHEFSKKALCSACQYTASDMAKLIVEIYHKAIKDRKRSDL